jgi:plasmid stability protein
MAQIVVRGLDDELVKRLRRRAKQGGRTLQSEVKAILEQAARVDVEAARELAERIRSGFGGRKFDDSAALIREDYER